MAAPHLPARDNQAALPLKSTASADGVYRIVYTDHHDPFSVLGAHIISVDGAPALVVRAFLPESSGASVVLDQPVGGAKEHKLELVHPEGLFEVVLKGVSTVPPYMLKRRLPGGGEAVFHDSYAFLPTLTDFDLYLFNKGDHTRIFEKLGAHYAEVNGVGGVQFAVWAPSARSVSVIGDFNGWDRRRHAMRVLGSSGVWELFVPGLPEGSLYKFQVKTSTGFVLDKTDPYATEMEVRPRTAAIVNFLRDFQWHDAEWMSARAHADHASRPMSVYEVHLGSWKRGEGNAWLDYRQLAHGIVEYALWVGYTHIELMPVLEHPFDASWGYQVTGYFAPTTRFGHPADFAYFVDHCHRNGIGVILDWVPAHFPKDPHGLGWFDGSHLYEHADPRKGEHQDWGTLIFNYGRNEVRNFLIASALFWLEYYHIDGLRIDAVASMLYLDYSRKEGEWIPNQYGGRENLEAVELIKYLNSVVHRFHPGVLTIAEESTAWPGVTNSLEYGGLGFDLKWNMGWMHDMLEYFSKDPVHRSHHHRNLTFVLLYAFSERFQLPLSHDEVVHGKAALLAKMPGDPWQKFANLRSLYGLMMGFPGKKLQFMGADFGQWDEWQHDRSLDWHLLEFGPHKGLQRWVKDLHTMYRSQPALYETDFHYSGFQWIDFHDSASSVISFERRGRNPADTVVVVCNFTPVLRRGYRVGVPAAGAYRELLNSDAALYGGGNQGNGGVISSEAVHQHGRDHSVSLTLPPLGVLFLRSG